MNKFKKKQKQLTGKCCPANFSGWVGRYPDFLDHSLGVSYLPLIVPWE